MTCWSARRPRCANGWNAAWRRRGRRGGPGPGGGPAGGAGPPAPGAAAPDQNPRGRPGPGGRAPVACLNRHDSYTFFDATGDLLRTGLTHTNVMDVRVLL